MLLRSLLLLSVLTASLATAAEDGWLNARDCGASGSQFSTTATAVAGAKTITVADPGDFQVGQGVMLSKCNPRLLDDHLWGPKIQYTAGSGRKLKDLIDLQGYDETGGSWQVYILDILRTEPVSFRFSKDISRTWSAPIAVTYDWQTLSGGLQVRFHKGFDWTGGYTASFSARDQLVSVVEKVEGRTITLRDATPQAAEGAVLRHCDDAALQAAIDRCLAEKRNLLVPNGWYRLSRGLSISKPSGLTISGENGEDTVLDLSEGMGACLQQREGTEVNIRDFRMIGNMGFAERDQCGSMPMKGCGYLWGQDLKTSFAVATIGTQRVYVENVHAYRMSLEAFWSGGPSRSGNKPEPPAYSRSIIYERCWAIDCGRNAFNNNDMAEGTTMSHCRIVDVGGCAWEGASRFVKFVNNYVRNAGTVAIGNISSRSEDFEVLPSGQHIVAGNVFESVVPYGGCAIRCASGCTPVAISGNLFVNFGSSAIELSGHTGPGLPPYTTTVSANIFDMTEVGPTSRPRHAIQCTENDVIIADNQIYVRGAADPNVIGIRLYEPALNVNVHDNLIRGCGTGLLTGRSSGRVGTVIDGSTFEGAGGFVPLERRRSHRYQGWPVVWLAGGKVTGTSTIESFDPETKRFKLAAPRDLKAGESFDLYPPYGANWNLHDNTITDCLTPVVIDSYGSESTVFRGNTVSRGSATGVKQALSLAGRCQLRDNLFCGFDEPESVAVMLLPDRFGKAVANVVSGNLFERCGKPRGESQAGLWEACAQ